MTPSYRLRRRSLVVPALSLCALTLVACGTSSKATPGTSTSPSPSPSSSRSGNGGFRNNALFEDPKVKQCLSAAGIALPSARPSGSARPSFTGAPPSGARPSGANGFNGFGGDNSKIQQALEACGIAVPTGRPTSTPAA